MLGLEGCSRESDLGVGEVAEESAGLSRVCLTELDDGVRRDQGKHMEGRDKKKGGADVPRQLPDRDSYRL